MLHRLVVLLVSFAAPTPASAQTPVPALVGGAREVARLSPSELGVGDAFGRAVVLQGDTLFVGAEAHDLLSTQEGAVYVFDRQPDGSWDQSARIDPPGVGNYQSRFGSALAVDGDLLAVGWPGKNQRRGGVALFERDDVDATQWNEVKTILGTTTMGWLGQALALRGDELVVGAPDACFNIFAGCTPAEQTHFYRRDAGGPGNWGEIAVFPSPAGQCDGFGAAVAAADGFFLVGAPAWDIVCNTSPPASVHVFASPGGTPVPVNQLFPFPSTPQGDYGQALAVSDTLVAIGFRRSGYGAVSVLGIDGTTLGPLVELTGEPAGYPQGYGRSVAVGRDVVAVGEPFASGNPVGESAGRVWIYARNQGGSEAWGLVQVLQASDGRNGDRFGEALALEGRTLVVGATEKDIQPGYVGDPGVVYVYELPFLDRPAHAGGRTRR